MLLCLTVGQNVDLKYRLKQTVGLCAGAIIFVFSDGRIKPINGSIQGALMALDLSENGTHTLPIRHFTSLQEKQIAIWLFIVAGLIFCMILLGGVTRLTHSGLSIVEWKPLTGILPPLNEGAWQQEFLNYQAFPEYQKLNQGMSLAEFKRIFYFEYFHRLLGRLIGVFFLLPMLFFWYRGVIKKSLLPHLGIIFLLGAGQGLLGWYMVKSGLVDNPHVSQYRLTAHLMAAVCIYGYILWVAFGLLKAPADRPQQTATNKLYRSAVALTGLVALMITSGGFVAGLKAGLAYNTFPLMDGQWIPDHLYVLQPFWLNWFENITTVQFNHRVIGWFLVILIPVFSYAVRKRGITARSRTVALFFPLLILGQFLLGITTLLLGVPVATAAAHQGGAIVIFTVALYLVQELKPIAGTNQGFKA